MLKFHPRRLHPRLYSALDCRRHSVNNQLHGIDGHLHQSVHLKPGVGAQCGSDGDA